MTASACQQCGTSVAASAKFCSECGAPLRDSAGPRAPAVPESLAQRMRADAERMAGERKLVTVLFADIAGSMDLAEQVDPERWREIMAGLSERLGGAVHRYEGTIDKFTGDGIMALFGAPIAHEDHARRACLAALAMQESMSSFSDEIRRSDAISLALRVGVNSGEVVVGGIGDDLGLDYTAVGHTVGLAQRMETLAEPGTAYATESTARLAEGLIEFDDLGEFNVKGSSEPMHVHRVAREGLVGGRFEAARRRGLSPFVGRAREMDVLSERLDQAIKGTGSVAGIVAPAGTGKSRLCHEVERLAHERGVNVYRTACQPHGRNIPYLPVLQMLRSYFGIEPSDGAREAREKAAGRLLLLDPSFDEELALIFEFIGIPDPARPAPQLGPEAKRDRLLAIVGKVMAIRGESEAAVTIIEDLHWIDPASEEFMRGLVAATPGSRSLTLANYRPEYEAEWMGPDHTTELKLEPLGPEDVSSLLADLLGSDPSLDGLVEIVAEQARGNPFYVEEIVRTLAESGRLEGKRGEYRLAGEIGEIRVPESVQAILAARIDRLSPAAKDTLHCAAVAGGTVHPDLLAHALATTPAELGPRLTELVEGEFLAAVDARPVVYDFVHPLTREVAFNEQLVKDRRRFHAAIARAIEELDPTRLDERAAEIAQHLENAAVSLAAAGWHARAFEWLRTRDLRAAVEHLRRIRSLGPELGDGEDAKRMLLFASGGLLQASWRAGDPDFDELAEAFDAATGILAELPDPYMTAIVHTGYGLTVGTCEGLVADYYRHAKLAYDSLTEASEDPALRVVAETSHPYAAFLVARYEEALRAGNEVLRLTEQDPTLGRGFILQNPRSFATSFRALPLMGLGRFAEALPAALEGIELAQRFEDRESLGWSHTFAASVYAWAGRAEYEEGIAHARSAIEIGLEMGHIQSQMIGRIFMGDLIARSGEAEEGIAVMEEALEGILSRKVCVEFEPFLLAGISRAVLEIGDFGKAVELAARAQQIASDRGALSYAGMTDARLAEALAARAGAEDLKRADALLVKAEQWFETPGGFNGPWLLRARAALCKARGDETGRGQALGAALEMAQEMGILGLVAELEAELAVSP